MYGRMSGAFGEEDFKWLEEVSLTNKVGMALKVEANRLG
jgi:hypothetical protein